MKISELTVEYVAEEFLRLDAGEYSIADIEGKIISARSYVSNYTGLPVTSDDEDCCDDFEEMTHAVLVLIQDMYDNRSMYVLSDKVNFVVASILDMHRRNLM